MQLPEECNFKYPNLYWKEKANRFTSTIATKLFKEKHFNLGERLNHLNHYTFVYFESKENLITEKQHNTLTDFLNNQNQFKKEIDDAVANYLNNEVKDLLEPADYSEIVNKNISDIILLHHVHLPYSTDSNIIGFEFECAWDDEHGFGIKFTDGLISNVGMADIAF